MTRTRAVYTRTRVTLTLARWRKQTCNASFVFFPLPAAGSPLGIDPGMDPAHQPGHHSSHRFCLAEHTRLHSSPRFYPMLQSVPDTWFNHAVMVIWNTPTSKKSRHKKYAYAGINSVCPGVRSPPRKDFEYRYISATLEKNMLSAPSVGRQNPTRVDEGRKSWNLLAIKNARHEPYWGGGRRACYVTPDLSYA